MRIHETYTKKDIVKIIEDNNITHIDFKLTRYEIVKEFNKWIADNCCHQKFSFLEGENKNKKLTIKERNEIIVKAQQVISLHKNGYNYSSSCYKNKNELLKECIDIANYGDISSVRRAIKFVNNKYPFFVELNISEETKNKLDHKVKLKKDATPKLFVKFGKVKVNFD